jgi:hypothetical protein
MTIQDTLGIFIKSNKQNNREFISFAKQAKHVFGYNS